MKTNKFFGVLAMVLVMMVMFAGKVWARGCPKSPQPAILSKEVSKKMILPCFF